MTEINQKAEVRISPAGWGVYFSNTLLRDFDARSDDYAFTNATDYAREWNEGNERRPNPAHGAPRPAGHNPVA